MAHSVWKLRRRRHGAKPHTVVQRHGTTAVVQVHGDLVVETAGEVWSTLRSFVERRSIRKVVLDLANAGRLDSAGVAVVSLASNQCAAARKPFELANAADHHRAAMALFPEPQPAAAEDVPPVLRERIGDSVIDAGSAVRGLARIVVDIVRQTALVLARRAKLPRGAILAQVSRMGTDAVFIVSLLTFLLGASISLQSVLQLNKVGAGVYVADLVGFSMIREFAPIMTAFLVTGRTGAAIAAELGTMKMRSELDALTAMGVSPIRYHVVPRLASLTIVGPVLTMIGMVTGILGGIVVATMLVGMPPAGFWSRMTERVELGDFLHGLGKSLAFAWIIGLVGTYCGLRAAGDAASVGRAATRAVVASILFVVLIDAAFPAVATLLGDA